MRRRLILPVILVMAAMTGGAGSASPEPAAPVAGKPRRVVSVNLCADQLVLALADRDQIAGLSRNAADPEMSAAAGAVGDLPVLRDLGERLLAIQPDLVMGMPPPASGAARRYRVLDVPDARSLDEIHASIRAVAAALGHPARGERLIARMARELAAIPPVGKGEVAAYYQRRGYLTGTGTLIDGLMTRLGLVNLATRLGKPALSQLSLEAMIADPPDYLIVERATDRVADQGTEMLHHPVLDGIPRITIPQAWTVCGGPAYVLAARAIAGQVARHRRIAAR